MSEDVKGMTASVNAMELTVDEKVEDLRKTLTERFDKALKGIKAELKKESRT